MSTTSANHEHMTSLGILWAEELEEACTNTTSTATSAAERLAPALWSGPLQVYGGVGGGGGAMCTDAAAQRGSGQPRPTALSLCIQTLCCGHNENCELCLIAGSEG